MRPLAELNSKEQRAGEVERKAQELAGTYTADKERSGEFLDQMKLLLLYNLEGFAGDMEAFTRTSKRFDLARISLILTGDLAFAKGALGSDSRKNQEEIITEMTDYAWRKRFPESALFLEKRAQLQAAKEDLENQNAFLKEFLRLTKEQEELKAAFAEAGTEKAMKTLKEENDRLKKELERRDREAREETKDACGEDDETDAPLKDCLDSILGLLFEQQFLLHKAFGRDGQAMRQELSVIRKMIRDLPERQGKGVFKRRRKTAGEACREGQGNDAAAPGSPELDRIVCGILKDPSFEEGQLNILLSCVEQGLSQEALKELADPKLPEANMLRLARYQFAKQGRRFVETGKKDAGKHPMKEEPQKARTA